MNDIMQTKKRSAKRKIKPRTTANCQRCGKEYQIHMPASCIDNYDYTKHSRYCGADCRRLSQTEKAKATAAARAEKARLAALKKRVRKSTTQDLLWWQAWRMANGNKMPYITDDDADDAGTKVEVFHAKKRGRRCK